MRLLSRSNISSPIIGILFGLKKRFLRKKRYLPRECMKLLYGVDLLTRFKQIGRAVIEIPANSLWARSYIEMAFADEITCHENIRLLFRRSRHSKTNIATHFREIIYLPRAETICAPPLLPEYISLTATRRQRSSEETWTGS